MKPLSDFKTEFKPSYLQTNDVDTSEKTSQERTFQFDDFITKNESIQRGFSYDSEKARNFDQSSVDKAKIGVKELLKDAIEKAKREVGELKSNARKEGYDSGYEAGFKKGEESAKEESRPFLVTIQEMIKELTGFRKENYDKVEREMVEMVISLAKKVIHFEFSMRENAVQDMIRLAVDSVLDKESMVIKINPTDKKYAEKFSPELHRLFDEIKTINFQSHPGIERGGCIIETNFGVIDASIEKLEEQIDQILNLSPAPPENSTAASDSPKKEEDPDKSQPREKEPEEEILEASDSPKNEEGSDKSKPLGNEPEEENLEASGSPKKKENPDKSKPREKEPEEENSESSDTNSKGQQE